MPLRFTIDQVNHFVLQKQHLTPGSRGKDIASVIGDIGPVRATPAITPNVSLWARVADFDRKQLRTALHEERSLVRAQCMHARLFMIPSADLGAYYQAFRPLLRHGLHALDELLSGLPGCLPAGQAGQKGARRGDETALLPFGTEPAWRADRLAQRVLEVMSARGPSTVAELAQLLPELDAQIYHDPEHPELGYSKLGTRLIPAMCAEGLLVRAQMRGGWRSDLCSYLPLSAWLPEVDLESLSPRNALQHVIRDYVSAFGPVTVGDMLHWLGGYARRQIVGILMSLGDDLTRVQVSGSRGDYFLLKDQVCRLADCSLEKHSACLGGRQACLLPPRDSYPMAYSDTSRFLAESDRERVFDRVGESLGTVWLDGSIAGTWWMNMREERIIVRFFEAIDPEALALVGEEARRLGESFEFPSLDIDIGAYAEQGADHEEDALSIFALGNARH